MFITNPANTKSGYRAFRLTINLRFNFFLHYSYHLVKMFETTPFTLHEESSYPSFQSAGVDDHVS